jgi:hypothetical protein
MTGKLSKIYAYTKYYLIISILPQERKNICSNKNIMSDPEKISINGWKGGKKEEGAELKKIQKIAITAINIFTNYKNLYRK